MYGLYKLLFPINNNCFCLSFETHSQSASDAAYISRHIALKANVPVTTPALTVNRLCGSGFQAVVTAAQEIQLGESDIVLCGGSENMSQAPYALRDARFGTKLGLDLKVRFPGFQDFLHHISDYHQLTEWCIFLEFYDTYMFT